MSKDGLIVDIETCHEDAEIPEYQNEGDAGMDIRTTEIIKNTEHQVWFKTGIKISVPSGYVGLIYPRSSITELPLELGNSVGVIDSGYTGEIQVRFNKTIRTSDSVYKKGERVAQLIIMPYPQVSFREVESLSDSSRGSQGFGSTGGI